MKALKMGLAALGSAVVLAPLSVTAQESPSPSSLGLPPFLTWTDASGDLRDLTTGEPTDGPGHTDIIGLNVSIDPEARFQGLVFARDTLPGQPDHPLDPAGWLDRVPDVEDE